ncbi:MAG: hypothetical protein J6T53_07100 [Bacteroidales bacterium]|nr:hypothetical protein [Bacteroidales bacterium]
MAKKVKKPISKPKKKGSSKKKKSGNIFTKLIVIIFVIILAFFLIFSVFRPSNKTAKVEKPTSQLVEKQEKKDVKAAENPKAEEKATAEVKKDEKAEKKAAETKVVEQSIKGTWQSTTGGAFLTMDGKEYRLDFMGVDSDLPIIGTYSVDGDLITFINKKDPCKDVKGLYEVKFNKNEIGFKCKSDDCTKRKATLPTEWEWLDTEE